MPLFFPLPVATAPGVAARRPALSLWHPGNLPPRVCQFYPARSGNGSRGCPPAPAATASAAHYLPAARSTGVDGSFHCPPAKIARQASRSRLARRFPGADRVAGALRLSLSATEAGYSPDLTAARHWQNQTVPPRACRPAFRSRCQSRNAHSGQWPRHRDSRSWCPFSMPAAQPAAVRYPVTVGLHSPEYGE